MKYAKPEVTALTDAIHAIQALGSKPAPSTEDASTKVEPIACYEDAE
jgi:hypothetical protein